MRTFRNFLEKQIETHINEWEADENEHMREINTIVKSHIDSTHKLKNFGIDDINFTVISSNKGETGTKLSLEGAGTANAKNEMHVKKLLAQLMEGAKADLARKNIRLEVLYNQIDTNIKEDEVAIGLVRKISFKFLASAFIRTLPQNPQ